MASTRDAETRGYLSIIAWPDGLADEQIAHLLADATGLDVPTMLLAARRSPPVIIGRYERAIAEAGAQAVSAAGGVAFAPTLADIEALGPTLKIKDLSLRHGDVKLDLWRGPGTTIRRDQVQILIRAHLSRPGPRPRPSAVAPLSSDFAGRVGRATVAFGLYGALGLALALEAGYLAGAEREAERRLVTSDKLDIHTTDGRVFQIDGDKFGYQILGESKGYSDKANMDAMCELLATLAPDEIVDPYFSLWSPPADYKHIRLPMMRINNDDPAFAFYSRWAALMYRHLLGTKPAGT